MNYDLIQIITGIAGLITIFLLWWQIKSQLKWNKLNCSLGKVDMLLFDKNQEIIKSFGINMDNDEMDNEEYIKLTDKQNFEILFNVQEILDMFEDFATLYNMNVLNKHYSYESYSEVTLFVYFKYGKIIDFYRNNFYDPFYYKNLEKCANDFLKIKIKELNNYDIKIKKFNKMKEKTTTKFESMQPKLKFKTSVFKDKL